MTTPAVSLLKYIVKKNPTTGSYTDKTIYLDFHNIDGLSYTSVVAIFKIVGPDGSDIYKNIGYDTDDFGDFDMYYNVSPPVFINTLTKNLPLDIKGNILKGTYTVYMKGFFGTLGGIQANYSWTIDYEYDSPVITPALTFDCTSSPTLVTSTDLTIYPADNTLTRSHTIYQPSGIQPVQPDPVTGSTAIITDTPIYPGEYTSEIISDLLMTLSNTWFIVDSARGVEDAEADCNFDLCNIQCGLSKLYVKYKNTLPLNPSLANTYLTQITKICNLVVLFNLAQQCGKTTLLQGYKDDMITIGEFTEECGC